MTEEFQQRFQEFDEVVDASVRIFMSEGFKGVIRSPKNGDEGEPILDTRSALHIKAEAILSSPHDEIEAAEEERLQKLAEKAKQKSLEAVEGDPLAPEIATAAIVVEELVLDGRLLLKDRALKSNDLELYH